ncbi:hypothetical protein EV424DRAFT_1347804 [Suillus variegatus]|nr:hypothetical protein EV424DRAFT_1347804 [Suillus variegatus]
MQTRSAKSTTLSVNCRDSMKQVTVHPISKRLFEYPSSSYHYTQTMCFFFLTVIVALAASITIRVTKSATQATQMALIKKWLESWAIFKVERIEGNIMESKAQLRHMRCMRNMAERFDEIVLGSKKQATKESLQESEIGKADPDFSVALRFEYQKITSTSKLRRKKRVKQYHLPDVTTLPNQFLSTTLQR